MKLRFSRSVVHGLLCAFVAILAGGLQWGEAIGRAGHSLTSWEYRFRDVITVSGRFQPPDPRLVFLGIDSTSVNFSQLDLETLYANVPANSPEHRALALIASGWPWSREIYALIAERLLATGARGVAFDLLLPKPGLGDAAFAATIQRHADRIVLGANFAPTVIGPREESWSLDLPTQTLAGNLGPGSNSIGYVNFWPDFDGIIRNAFYRTTLEQLQLHAPPPAMITPALPAALANRAARWVGASDPPQPFQPHLIRFSGPPGSFNPIPVYEIFLPSYWERNFAGGAFFRDKIVLVGPAGNWTHDEHRTPFGLMPGPELHLQSLNALMHRAFLQEWPQWTVFLLIAIGSFAAWCLSASITRIWWRLGAFILGAAMFLFAVKLTYDYLSLVVPAISPVLAFATSGLASFIYDYTRETLEKLRVRRTLESYVSKEAARDILDNPESFLHALGGQRTKVALILTDLRGFTTLSERMDSHQLVMQLNEYLTLMVADVFAFRGSVDKFIGDAVLAVWGSLSSVDSADDAKNALRAALKMQVSLRELNADWTRRGMQNFAMGCGLNYGEVVFGNIGSAQKKELTVIGDTVNVTARLEGLTKDYGRDLLMGEAAAELVRDEFTLQFVDCVAVKGKSNALNLYTVIGPAGQKLEEIVQDCLGLHAEACAAYRRRDFDLARRHFRRCLELRPEDKLPSLYLERCEIFLKEPPPEDWEGVWVALHK